jgi:hypothetical protein
MTNYQVDHIPNEMRDMMKHLSEDLQTSFNKLWASQQSQKQPVAKHSHQTETPVLSDRITRSMTLK